MWVQGVGIILQFFSCAIEICCLTFSLSLFRFFFVTSPVNWKLLMHRNCCVCCAKLFTSKLSDHYSVDLLGKGRVF